jgi:putative sigma-54 modulation protein
MKLEIDGVHKLDNRDISRYINKKIGGLDKYLPRHARKSAHAEVKVREEKVKDKKVCMCEVVLHLPHDTLTAKESTMNMFAAVDIVEEKIKIQAKKYKEKNRPARGARLRSALQKFSRG